MKKEPRGLMATFVVTKTYHVTCYGNTEDECWSQAEALGPDEIYENDFIEMEIELKDGFEYDSL
jgi:hypothetical protein